MLDKEPRKVSRRRWHLIQDQKGEKEVAKKLGEECSRTSEGDNTEKVFRLLL